LQQSYGASPDNDNDNVTKQLAYRGKLAHRDSALNMTNFSLESDDALALWVLNNQLFKPDMFLQSSASSHGYRYSEGAASGEKLFLTFPSSPSRFLRQMEESLAYASKASTKPVGSEPRTRGSIANSVDLAAFGYEHEHSALWRFDLAKMAQAYQSLMDKLRVERNP